MLTKFQLAELFDKLGTPTKGRELIMRARTEAPVREVKSTEGNVVSHIQSKKMGRTIETESRQPEFTAAIDMEYDDTVIEYYPQPCELKLDLTDPATGEIRRIKHTPDFLIISHDGFTLEEWKTEEMLKRLSEKYPYRYQCDEDGQWYSEQIEEQLAKFGIRYRLHSHREKPPIRIENYLHLADYFRPATEPCPPEVLERVNAILKEEGSVYLNELLDGEHKFSVDHLLKAIVDRQLVIDVDHEPLTQVRRCRVYRDEILRDFQRAQHGKDTAPSMDSFVFDIAPGVVFKFESKLLTISVVGEKEVICTNEDSQTVTLEHQWMIAASKRRAITMVSTPANRTLEELSRFSKAQLKTALKRQDLLSTSTAHEVRTSRTMRRWLQRQKAVLVRGGNEIIALVPHTNLRGNRECRLTDEQLDLIQQTIRDHWLTNKAENFKTCHGKLVTACVAADIKPPSYPTFIRYVKMQATDNDVMIRNGKRLAYQQSAFVDVLHYDTPVHGSRPFQYVHIDHTQLDIELISSRTGKPLGRPWLTMAVDAFTRRVLAIYLSFDPPSQVAVMMVIRDMVRRFNRLPEFFILDNGADLRSEGLRNYSRIMGVHIRFRPAGRPRHGAVMERLFGTANTQYIHNLAGNTKATKNVRQVTGKHLPKNLAEWTLEAMYFGLEYWAFTYYDQEFHPALGASPREMFQMSLRTSGMRSMRQVIDNRDFRIATCIPVKREGVRSVNTQTGVKVDERYYWNPQFRNPRLSGQKLPVLYDPWDASSVYVRHNDEWLHARCRALSELGQMTEKERAIFVEEFGRCGGDANDLEKSQQRLKEFQKVFTPQGALEYAMERQEEMKGLYNSIGMSNVSPVSASEKFPQIHFTSHREQNIDSDDSFDTSSAMTSVPTFSNDLPEFDDL